MDVGSWAERCFYHECAPKVSLAGAGEPLPHHRDVAGACSGILTVTAEAVDYRSHDGHDVFHIPSAEMHSVSRSRSAPQRGLEHAAPVSGLPHRGPGHSYGFFAYEEDPKLAGTPAGNRVRFQDTTVKTKELFELVYRLWSQTLKPKQN